MGRGAETQQEKQNEQFRSLLERYCIQCRHRHHGVRDLLRLLLLTIPRAVEHLHVKGLKNFAGTSCTLRKIRSCDHVDLAFSTPNRKFKRIGDPFANHNDYRQSKQNSTIYPPNKHMNHVCTTTTERDSFDSLSASTGC